MRLTFRALDCSCCWWLYTVILMTSWTWGQNLTEFREFWFTLEPSDVIASRDRPVLFDCSVHLDQSARASNVSVTWLRDGHPVILASKRTVLNNGSLLLEGRPEEGWYQCLVSCPNLGSIISRRANLQMAYLEKSFEEEPKDATIYLGDTVLLPCTIHGAPVPVIQWFKDEKELDLQNLNYVMHPEDGVLEILGLQFPDFGRYKCRASNGERTKYSVTVSLVQNANASTYQGVPPDFVMKPKDKVVTEGASVVFHCAANGNDRNGKRPKILWLKDGLTLDISKVDGRHSIVGGSSLRVDSVEEGDGGLYVCRASNSEDTVDAGARLTVQVSPKLRTRLRDTVVPKMSDKDLVCDIYANPRPTIQWYRNGEPVVADDYVQLVDSQTLRIMGFSMADSAIYQCIASNKAGSIQLMAQVIVTTEDLLTTRTGSPSPPVDVAAVVVSMRFLMLSWRQPNASGLSDIIGYLVRWKENGSEKERELNTTLLEANVQHLKPSTKYFFRVYAYNLNGLSNSAPAIMIETQTEAQVPDAPANLRATALSSTAISVTWSSPRENTTGSPLSGYKLYYYDFGDSEAEKEVAVSSASYVFTDLKKFHQYSFHVVAFNENGLGSSTEEVVCSTFSDVPSALPQNVTVEIHSATSIIVRWLAPPEDSLNGIITGYRIQYRPTSDKSSSIVVTDGAQTMHILTDLRKGAEYSLSIQAQTVNGTGPATPWFVADTLTHDLDETVVPGMPASLQVRPQTNAIVVSWTPPHEQDILIRGYILGYGVGVPDVYRQIIDPKLRYYSIKNLNPSSEYVISLRAFNHVGEGKQIYETTFTREETTPEPLTPIIPPVGLKAIVLSSSTIMLTWIDTTLGRNQRVTDKRHYVVRYTPRTPRKFRFVNSTELNVHVDDLRPDVEYEFSVKIVKGLRQSTWSLNVLNRTKEASPATAPRDVTAVAVEQTPSWVSLSWQPPRQTNGQITGYLVFYTTDSSQKDRDWVVEGVLGDRLSVMVRDLSLETTYYFKVQARNSIGYGPMSPTIIFRMPRSDGTGGGPIDTPDDYGKPTKFYYRDFSNMWFTTSPVLSPSGFPAAVLWITVGCIGGAVALVVLVVAATFFCSRRRKTCNRATHSGYMPGTKDKNVLNLEPPDLWFHHQTEAKTANRSDDADEQTSMMKPEAVRKPKAGYCDGRPGHRPKASMIPIDQPPMTREIYKSQSSSGSSGVHSGKQSSGVVRPVYPRTQYMSNFVAGPKVNAGYPQLLLPQGDSTDNQSVCHSDTLTAESNSSLNLNANVNPLPLLGSLNNLKRNMSKSPNASDAKSLTNEELTEEMANLEGLMKDLSAITQHQFEC